MQTILVANPKGGSGKTTLATNVAGWLAGKRQRVLLTDLDPQQSATQWLARRPRLFPADRRGAGHAKRWRPPCATRSGRSSTARRESTATISSRR